MQDASPCDTPGRRDKIRLQVPAPREAVDKYEGIINTGIAIRNRAAHLNLRRPIAGQDTGITPTTAALNSILDQPLDDGTITPDEALEIIRR